jgi:hypothetical protein
LGDAAGRGKVQLTDYPCPRGPVTREQLSVRELPYVPLEHAEFGAADIGKMKIADFIHWARFTAEQDMLQATIARTLPAAEALMSLLYTDAELAKLENYDGEYEVEFTALISAAAETLLELAQDMSAPKIPPSLPLCCRCHRAAIIAFGATN